MSGLGALEITKIVVRLNRSVPSIIIIVVAVAAMPDSGEDFFALKLGGAGYSSRKSDLDGDPI